MQKGESCREGQTTQPLDEPRAGQGRGGEGDRISDHGPEQRENAQTQANLTRADWHLGYSRRLSRTINQSSSRCLLAAKWSREMQWPGNGRVQQALGWRPLRTWTRHMHMAPAARCDMACVCDVNSFGGGPSWDPGLCRSLPLQKRDRVESSVWSAGGEFWGAQEVPMRREGNTLRQV